jgi:hypothetical protein
MDFQGCILAPVNFSLTIYSGSPAAGFRCASYRVICPTALFFPFNSEKKETKKAPPMAQMLRRAMGWLHAGLLWLARHY